MFIACSAKEPEASSGAQRPADGADAGASHAKKPDVGPTAPPQPDSSGSIGSPLPGVVVEAAPGLKGVDAFATISAEAAKAMAADGYVFAARYIQHSETETHHITRQEAEDILDAGLALFLVQIGRGWRHTIPTADRGRSDGELAVNKAKALGYPAGAVVFLDIESVLDKDAKAEDVIVFATAWHDAVEGSFVPGYYVGPSGRLTAAQLGALPFQHFWKSGTKVPTPSGRGYQLTQHRYRERGKNVVHGVGIDYDITQNDEQGTALPWLAPVTE